MKENVQLLRNQDKNAATQARAYCLSFGYKTAQSRILVQNELIFFKKMTSVPYSVDLSTLLSPFFTYFQSSFCRANVWKFRNRYISPDNLVDDLRLRLSIRFSLRPGIATLQRHMTTILFMSYRN